MTYFINIDGLIDQHAKNEFDDHHAITYLLCFYVQYFISNAFSQLFLNTAESKGLGFSLMNLVIMLVVGLVIFFLYKGILGSFENANGGGKSTGLLNRLLSIGWVYTFRASIVIFPVMSLVAYDPSGIPLLVLFVVAVSAVIYTYFGMVNSLKKITEKQNLGIEPLI